MPTITFHVNNHGLLPADYDDDPTLIEHTEGSGLGFYGGGFGISVPVGQYQDTTFVVDENGLNQDVRVQNLKYNTVSGNLPNGAAVELANSGTPNFYAPLNIRFSHDSEVKVQNCKLRIFDRNDINNDAEGVTTQVYEVRHPNPLEGEGADYGALEHRGIVQQDIQHSWVEFPNADMDDMTLTPGPGVSGLNTLGTDHLPENGGGYKNYVWDDGAAHESKRHDWYLGLSASPDSIGSKTAYGLYFTLEYL